MWRAASTRSGRGGPPRSSRGCWSPSPLSPASRSACSCTRSRSLSCAPRRSRPSEAPSVHAFRAAVERADLDAAVALLADDVVFRSPAVFKPYEGRETVATILRTVFSVFEDFRYTDELAGDGVHGLIFEARVGERSLQGLDLLRTAADGRTAEVTGVVLAAGGAVR